MKLIYDIANNNSFDEFKRIIKDEYGEKVYNHIKSLTEVSNDYITDILNVICNLYSQYSVNEGYLVTTYDLKNKDRRKYISEARHMACYMLKKYPKLTLYVIGRILGNKDHASVIHGIKVITSRVETKQLLIENIEFIRLEKYIKELNEANCGEL